MKLTVFIQVEIETNDQPHADVRSRLANKRGFVGEDIGRAARKATENAMWLFGPESYFPGWPPDGKLATVTKVKQHTRRSD
jgi:hypothetical protein